MSLFRPRSIVPLSLAWLVFVLVVFSDAAAHYLIVILAVMAIGLWGLSWLVRVLILLIDLFASRLRRKLPQSKSFWKLLWIGIEPAAIVLSFALIFLNIPLSIRLKLSEPALTSYVQEVRAGRRSPQKRGEPARQVGLFEVRETELLEGSVVRLITAEDFVDHAGLVYSPQRQPPIQGEDTYRHLYGSWWHWHRSW